MSSAGLRFTIALSVLSLLVVALMVGPGPASATAATTPVLAYGVVAYSIVKDGVPPTCAGEGPFAVTYDDTTNRLTLAGTAVGCAPIFSAITACILGEDGTVTCDKAVGAETVLITLSPDGILDYLWDAPDFHEEIAGHMERTG